MDDSEYRELQQIRTAVQEIAKAMKKIADCVQENPATDRKELWISGSVDTTEV